VIVLGEPHERADPAYPVGLLRARRAWPSERCAANERDELAPLNNRGVLLEYRADL